VRKSRPVRLFVASLAGAGLLALVVTVVPVVRWWALWLSAGWAAQTRPVVVVLAGDELADGTIGYSTYLRCVYAWWAYRRGGVETVILAGGPPERPAAGTMADFLAGLGLPRERMRLETASRNTRQNLANVAAMVGSEPVTLLTSDYHMRRGLLLARRAGVNAEPQPVPDALKRESEFGQRVSLSLLLGLESIKYIAESIGGDTR